MNISITGMSGLRDAVVASCLKTLMESMDLGISVDVAQALSAAKPAAPPTLLPAKRKYARKTKFVKSPKAAKPVAAKAKRAPKTASSAPAAAEPDSPRITIRQRVIDLLKTGPKTAIALANGLRAQGIEYDASRAGQHVWLLTRDGIAVRNDTDPSTWSLA